jgi:membrane protein DedA with SNARE-associated domain
VLGEDGDELVHGRAGSREDVAMAAPPQLPGVFSTLAPVLDHYGYLAVAGFVLVEDFGVPVPGETILIAGAVYAGAGRLDLVTVALLAFAAALLGDNIGFAIGHFGGRRLVLRWGRYVLLTPERLARAEDWFGRHGGKVILVARFVEGLRQANGIVAGTSGMPWRRFVVFNAAGAALWVGVWTTVGYLSGTHLDTVYGVLRRVALYVLAALVAAVLLRIAVHLRRRRRPSSSEDAPPGR